MIEGKNRIMQEVNNKPPFRLEVALFEGTSE